MFFLSHLSMQFVSQLFVPGLFNVRASHIDLVFVYFGQFGGLLFQIARLEHWTMLLDQFINDIKRIEKPFHFARFGRTKLLHEAGLRVGGGLLLFLAYRLFRSRLPFHQGSCLWGILCGSLQENDLLFLIDKTMVKLIVSLPFFFYKNGLFRPSHSLIYTTRGHRDGRQQDKRFIFYDSIGMPIIDTEHTRCDLFISTRHHYQSSKIHCWNGLYDATNLFRSRVGWTQYPNVDSRHE